MLLTGSLLGQIKRKCVSGNGFEISRRVGRHIIFSFFIFWKSNIILCILKGISPFKEHKIIFFSRTPEKTLVSPENLGRTG